MELIGKPSRLAVNSGPQRHHSGLLRLSCRGGIGDPIAVYLISPGVPLIGIAHDLPIRQTHDIANADLASPARIGAAYYDAMRPPDIKHFIIVERIVE